MIKNSIIFLVLFFSPICWADMTSTTIKALSKEPKIEEYLNKLEDKFSDKTKKVITITSYILNKKFTYRIEF